MICMDKLYEWSSSNYLHFNLSKCTQLGFNSSFTTTYCIDDLGVTVSFDLSWNKHFDHITARLTDLLVCFVAVLVILSLYQPHARNFAYYASIMLDAFSYLLCQKLCRHNRRKPNCCMRVYIMYYNSTAI